MQHIPFATVTATLLPPAYNIANAPVPSTSDVTVSSTNHFIAFKDQTVPRH